MSGPPPYRGRRHVPARYIAGIAVAGALIAVGLATATWQPGGPVEADGAPLWRPRFAEGRGLVSNEVAYQDARRPGARMSADWIVTSGSLFFDRGAGWTGAVDEASPDVRSARRTGSAVLRAVSRRDDFGDVSVRLRLAVDAMTATRRTGRNAYDGVHVFLRYASPDSLYVVSVCRRDGTAAVKRKWIGSAGGTPRYTTLQRVPLSCPYRWSAVRVDVRTTGDGVRLTLWTRSRRVLAVLDRGQGGGAPLTEPGRVGIRGDNTAFRFRDFAVYAAR